MIDLYYVVVINKELKCNEKFCCLLQILQGLTISTLVPVVNVMSSVREEFDKPLKVTPVSANHFHLAEQ